MRFFVIGFTFMIKSGRKVPTPAIPIPDFAVPYAAPIPMQSVSFGSKEPCASSYIRISLRIQFLPASRLVPLLLQTTILRAYHSKERREIGRIVYFLHSERQLCVRKTEMWRADEAVLDVEV